ncbi:unnamed protein product [Didymodactylos carnosus]|uniref:Uncharacterized protein n=1 Tax=Didymodactylos carnosus TaxID=1234261 RepID=A0A814V6Y8_9BILA|nr:unnamed protein product [Didymodactylos carnosus]CAF3951348.1 unnamed protein product [Didymodactylos carnosus]
MSRHCVTVKFHERPVRDSVWHSPVMVIRELRRRGTTNIPERHTVTSIYQKFLETGSVGDRAHTGRPSTITEDKVQEIQQILDDEYEQCSNCGTRSKHFQISNTPDNARYYRI